MSRENEGTSGRGAIALLRAIRSGEISGRTIAAEERRRIVAHLAGEGVSVAEIAEILSVAERTIARDRAQLRKEAALLVGPEQVSETMGWIVDETRQSIRRLRAISRESGAPARDRVEAAFRAADIVIRGGELLRRIGMLPSAADQIQIEHSLTGLDPKQIEAEMKRLEIIDAEARALPDGDESDGG